MKIRRMLGNREATLTAAPRCIAYAACSELMASPHDVDPRQALADRRGIGEALPHALLIDPLVEELCGTELARLRRDYSALFEVGSEGPPVPIRESLQRAAMAGIREEVVRFYEHFRYRLGEQFAWQPDNLSFELEFMHYLCFHEARAAADVAAHAEGGDALPWQLAQLDFCERHLVSWVPALGAAVREFVPESLYARVLAGVTEFVLADHRWQTSTIGPAGAN
jgi:DMSO reductase family type II enzyme chaperone